MPLDFTPHLIMSLPPLAPHTTGTRHFRRRNMAKMASGCVPLLPGACSSSPLPPAPQRQGKALTPSSSHPQPLPSSQELFGLCLTSQCRERPRTPAGQLKLLPGPIHQGPLSLPPLRPHHTELVNVWVHWKGPPWSICRHSPLATPSL